MKISKKIFDFIFIVISALTLIVFSKLGYRGNMPYSLMPILVAYYLVQYSIKLSK